MKNKKNFLFYLLLLCMFLFLSNNQLVGQDSIRNTFKDTLNLSMELGIPVFINVGLRYQYKQTQFGIGILFIPNPGSQSILSVSGDAFYHFAGHSALSERKPWYGRTGINYLMLNSQDVIDDYLSLYIRLGREFNISKRVGFTFDIGPNFIVYQKGTILNDSSWNFHINFPRIGPGYSLGMYYRF